MSKSESREKKNFVSDAGMLSRLLLNYCRWDSWRRGWKTFFASCL